MADPTRHTHPGIVVTRTPLRVSFAGGGTDLPAFYQQEHGAVFSVAIQKHMYVTLSNRFEPSTRVAYSKTEHCDTIDEILRAEQRLSSPMVVISEVDEGS